MRGIFICVISSWFVVVIFPASPATLQDTAPFLSCLFSNRLRPRCCLKTRNSVSLESFTIYDNRHRQRSNNEKADIQLWMSSRVSSLVVWKVNAKGCHTSSKLSKSLLACIHIHVLCGTPEISRKVNCSNVATRHIWLRFECYKQANPFRLCGKTYQKILFPVLNEKRRSWTRNEFLIAENCDGEMTLNSEKTETG